MQALNLIHPLTHRVEHLLEPGLLHDFSRGPEQRHAIRPYVQLRVDGDDVQPIKLCQPVF